MIQTNKLKGAFASAGHSIPSAAKAIGMPATTMYYKLRTGYFTVQEVDDMIIEFKIKNWQEIFQFGIRK